MLASLSGALGQTIVGAGLSMSSAAWSLSGASGYSVSTHVEHSTRLAWLLTKSSCGVQSHGAGAVIKFILGLTRIRTLVTLPEIVEVNGSYRIFMTDDSGNSLITIGCRDHGLSDIFIQRNPDKLAGLRKSIVGSRLN